jgi:Tfp pilus assembly protein PilF
MRVHSRGRHAAPGGGGWLAAAALVLLAGVGCQTVKTQPAGVGLGPGAPGDPARQAASKTDFRSKVGPEQEFNVHLDLARAQESSGNNEAALAEYQKALEVCQKKGSVFGGTALGPAQQAQVERRMGAALDRLGRFAQGEGHYLRAMKATPNDPKVWNDVGYSYYVQGRLADAERALKTAAALEPNNQRVLTNLGLTYAAMGKLPDALATFSSAGGPAVGNANLAYALAASQKTDEARQYYQAALNHQPQFALARQALVQLDARRPAQAAATGVAAEPIPLPRPRQERPSPPVQVQAGPVPAGAGAGTDPQVSRTSATSYRSTAAPAGAALGAAADPAVRP